MQLTLATTFLDVAIFGSLMGLWALGATGIVLLFRWIRKFEREQTLAKDAQ